jgi:hypothetical protein
MRKRWRRKPGTQGEGHLTRDVDGKEGAASSREGTIFLSGTEEGGVDGMLQTNDLIHEGWSAAAKSNRDSEVIPFWWRLRGRLEGGGAGMDQRGEEAGHGALLFISRGAS